MKVRQKGIDINRKTTSGVTVTIEFSLLHKYQVCQIKVFVYVGAYVCCVCLRQLLVGTRLMLCPKSAWIILIYIFFINLRVLHFQFFPKNERHSEVTLLRYLYFHRKHLSTYASGFKRNPVLTANLSLWLSQH